LPDIDDVLERLVTDPEFRRHLSTDPRSALEGYDLDRSDLEVLSAQVTEGAGDTGKVEQRTSKSALAGLLGLFGSSDTSSLEDAMGTAPDTSTPSDAGHVGKHTLILDDNHSAHDGMPTSTTDDLGRVGFNPQPEPPGQDEGIIINQEMAPPGQEQAPIDPTEELFGAYNLQQVGFNPQPEPPGQDEGIIDDGTSARPLNPEWTNHKESDPGIVDAMPEGGPDQTSR
jgi:hypothetical protein